MRVRTKKNRLATRRVHVNNKWGEIEQQAKNVIVSKTKLRWNGDNNASEVGDGDGGDLSGTGVLGDLVLSNADIAIGAITPRSDLHQLFDFTVQYMQV